MGVLVDMIEFPCRCWVIAVVLFLLKECLSSDIGEGNHHSPTAIGKNDSIFSSVHCVGETYLPSEAWTFRTCRFWNLCWKSSDLSTITLFPSPEELELKKAFDDLEESMMTPDEASSARELVTISSSGLLSKPHISLQSIYNQEHGGLPWFPHIADTPSSSNLFSEAQITRLPNSVAVVPMVWTNDNPGKIWKDFYSVYTVLSMFGLSNDDTKIVLLDLGTKPKSAASARHLKQWQKELFGDHQEAFSVDPSAVFCASNAVAGLGRIASTSLNEGNENEDRQADFLTHSIFRGIGIFQFRQFALRRLGIVDPSDRKAICLCSDGEELCKLCASSENVVSGKGKRDVSIQTLDKHASLRDIALVGTSSQALFIDGTNPLLLPVATFLPRDATLIVIGSANERSFLQTWSHIRLVFLKSFVTSAEEYLMDYLP